MTFARDENQALGERLDFIGMDADARNLLRNLKPIVQKSIGPALDLFYAQVRREPKTAKFFGSDQHVAHAKGRQAQHWDLIASANYGTDYVRTVTAIGQAHARLGLEPRWYIGGYAIVAEQLVKSVITENWPGLLGLSKGRSAAVGDAVGALLKSVMLDMDLAISTYLDCIESERRKSEEMRVVAEQRQTRAVEVLEQALATLAQGDMRFRINEDLAPEFSKLKSNFNAAIEQLQKALLNVSGNSSMISATSTQITTAADDLSRRTEQQAASLEQTAAALDEITATMKKAAEGAAHALKVMVGAKDDAESGSTVVKRAMTAMGEIEKSSQQISQIIGVIDEIAFQTNLLALNAGVEAARAGEAGRGFAVVASEVRALAQRSANAAKEIKSLITASSTQVSEGVSLVADTGQALERIVARVLDINDVVTDIAAGAQEQATGLSQVNTAINQMDQMTQQNAAMVEQTTAASHALAERMALLDNMVSHFKLSDADGRQRHASKSPSVKTAPTARGEAVGPYRPGAPRRATAVAARPQARGEPQESGWEDF